MSADSRTSSIYGLIQTVLLCAFAVAIFTDRSRALFDSSATRPIGGLLCLAGVFLMVIALGFIRRSIQIAPAPREDAELVTTGVYSWFRHPIYTAIVIIVIGLFLRKPTPVAAAAAIVVIVYLAIKVRIEERLLLARYPEYAAYRTRTFGLFPWFRRRG